jgi:phospholipid-transporting ATPase
MLISLLLLAIPGSFVFTMLFLPIYVVLAPSIGFSLEYRGLDPRLFTDSVFWFTILLVPAICLSRDFVWK